MLPCWIYLCSKQSMVETPLEIPVCSPLFTEKESSIPVRMRMSNPGCSGVPQQRITMKTKNGATVQILYFVESLVNH